jgi:hypothetical protein
MFHPAKPRPILEEVSMNVAYRQCTLIQPRARASCHYVTWLPEIFASPGQVVRLRQADGSWSDGWRVDSVGPWTLSEEHMRKTERAYLKQRDASDI